MKIKNLKARMAGKSVVLSLTGFIELGKEYIVREAEIKGEKVILISEAHGVSRICVACNAPFEGEIIGDLCDECEKTLTQAEV